MEQLFVTVNVSHYAIYHLLPSYANKKKNQTQTYTALATTLICLIFLKIFIFYRKQSGKVPLKLFY